jgi:anti-sigma factor RsiW
MKAERDERGLTCPEVLAQLGAFVDGTLDAEARGAIAAHVQRCDRCAQFGGVYASVVREIRALAPAQEPDAAVLVRLRARLDRE